MHKETITAKIQPIRINKEKHCSVPYTMMDELQKKILKKILRNFPIFSVEEP